MIRMNPTMFDQLTYSNFANTGLNSVMYVCDGVVDFDTIMEDVANAASGIHLGYNFIDVRRALEAAGATFRGYFCFEPHLIARRPNENLVVFPLSESRVEMVKDSEGAVSWFIFAVPTTSAAEPNASSGDFNAMQIFIGSIGDIGSGKDMEIPGAAVSNDVDYKATDLTFELV